MPRSFKWLFPFEVFQIIYFLFITSATDIAHIVQLKLIMLLEAYSFRARIEQLSALLWHYCYVLMKQTNSSIHLIREKMPQRNDFVSLSTGRQSAVSVSFTFPLQEYGTKHAKEKLKC
jgi:hypothetical protein